MDPSIQLLAAAVLATAEFCAEPFDGGVGDPQFCRANSALEISTPFFSITVEPHFLVGVDREGRRLLIQSTLWQSQDYLHIEARYEAEAPKWGDCPEIREWVEAGVSWQDCRITTVNMHERRLKATQGGHYLLIEYGYSSLGTMSAPALERMTQSIRVHAT